MDNQQGPLRHQSEVSVVNRSAVPPVAAMGYHIASAPYGFDSPQNSEPGGGILEYWQILLRNRSTILIAALAGLVLGFAIGIPMKPVYRAHTSVEVLTLNQDFMNMKQANPTTSSDNSFDTSEEATQAKLLQSEALRYRVFFALDPTFSPSPNASPAIATSGWRKFLHLSQPAPMTRRQALLHAAAGSLKVTSTPHTRVLEISVDSTEPNLAADYANTLTREFIAQNAEDRGTVTQNTSNWLHRELDDARDKLRHSEDALQAYARDSGIIFTDETTNVANEKLQQLQQELSAASAERIARQSRYELAQNSPPNSLADVLNDPTLRETQSKINDLNRQIAALSAVFNPEYSKIRRLKAEHDSLQSALLTERKEILSRIQTDFQDADRKERLLAASYKMQTHEVTGQGQKTIQYNILKREVDSNRQLYDTMLQQMKQSSIAAAMRASNVHIVDPARTPDEPVFPNFKINAAVGTLACLFLSSIVVIVRDQADRTLQSPGEILKWADLPELGAIPSASRELKGLNRFLGGATAKSDFGYASDPYPAASSTASVELTTWLRKPSLMAESFRSALTSILFMGENGNVPRVLVFTSANPAEGKTTIVSNLGIASAEIRFKVLIIDADLRRPRMHQLFDLPNNQGLADLLQRDADLQTLPNLIQHTSVPGLHILSAGTASDAASHLLHSPNLTVILDRFKTEYDMILIDTPPMLQITDARVVGRRANAVVLVARAGETSRDALLTAKHRFEGDRIPVLGSILNDWDPKRSTNYYYGGYTRYSRT